MSQPTSTTETPGASAAKNADMPGLVDEIKALWHELRGLTHDHLKLALLETKLAAETLVSMIATSVMIAILLVSAWLGLLGAIAMAFIDNGMHPSVALLLITVINMAIAFLLSLLIRRQRRHLMWTSTMRTLKPKPHISDPRIDTPAPPGTETGKASP